MSAVVCTTYTCDFCGYGGPFSRAEGFTHHPGGIDLCRWCSDPKQIRSMECGRHAITFADDAWSCTCGEAYSPFVEVVTPTRVRNALPNIVLATAYVHSEQP